MLKGEFEALTETNVGYWFYKKVVEPMYLAAPEDFNKYDFSLLFTKKSILAAQKVFYAKYPELKITDEVIK